MQTYSSFVLGPRLLRTGRRWLKLELPSDAVCASRLFLANMMDVEKYPEFRPPFVGDMGTLQLAIVDSCEGLSEEEAWEVWTANEQPGHRAQMGLILGGQMSNNATLIRHWLIKAYDDIAVHGHNLPYSLGPRTKELIDFIQKLQHDGVLLAEILPVSRRMIELIAEISTGMLSVRISAGRPPHYGDLSLEDLETVKTTYEFKDLDTKALPMTSSQLTSITKLLSGEESYVHEGMRSTSWPGWLTTAYYALVKKNRNAEWIRIPDYGGWDAEVKAVVTGLDEEQTDKYVKPAYLYAELLPSKFSTDRGWWKAVWNRVVDARKNDDVRTGPITDEELAAGNRSMYQTLRLPAMYITNHEFKRITSIRASNNFSCDIEQALDKEFLPGNMRQVGGGWYRDRQLWDYLRSMQRLVGIKPELRPVNLGHRGEQLLDAVERIIPGKIPDASPKYSNYERILKAEIYEQLLDVFLDTLLPENVKPVSLENWEKIMWQLPVCNKNWKKSTSESNLLRHYLRLPALASQLGELEERLHVSEKNTALRKLELDGFPGSRTQIKNALERKNRADRTKKLADLRDYLVALDRDVNLDVREHCYGPHEDELAKLMACVSPIMGVVMTGASRVKSVSELSNRIMLKFHRMASEIISGKYGNWEAQAQRLVTESTDFACLATTLGRSRPPLMGTPAASIVKTLKKVRGTKQERFTLQVEVLDEMRVMGQVRQFMRDGAGEKHSSTLVFRSWWKWTVMEVVTSADDPTRRDNLITSLGARGDVIVETVLELLKRHSAPELTTPAAGHNTRLVYEAVEKVIAGTWLPTDVDIYIEKAFEPQRSSPYVFLGKSPHRMPAVGLYNSFLRLLLSGRHTILSGRYNLTLNALDRYGMPGSIHQIGKGDHAPDPEQFESWLRDMVRELGTPKDEFPYIIGQHQDAILDLLRSMDLTLEKMDTWESLMYGHVYNELLKVLRGETVEDEDLVVKEAPYKEFRMVYFPFEIPMAAPLSVSGPPKDVLEASVNMLKSLGYERKGSHGGVGILKGYLKDEMNRFCSRDQAGDIIRYVFMGEPDDYAWKDIWSLEHAMSICLAKGRTSKKIATFVSPAVKAILGGMYAANRTESRLGNYRKNVADPAVNYAWYRKLEKILFTDDVSYEMPEEEIEEAKAILSSINHMGYLRLPFTRPFKPELARIVQSRMLTLDKKMRLIEEANLPGTKSQLYKFMRTSYASHNYRSDFKNWLRVVLQQFFTKSEDGVEIAPTVHLGSRQPSLLQTIGSLDLEIIRGLGNTQEDSLVHLRLYNVLVDVLGTGIPKSAYSEVHVTGRFNVAEALRGWLVLADPAMHPNVLDKAVSHFEVLISKNAGGLPFAEDSIEHTVQEGLRALKKNEDDLEADVAFLSQNAAF